MIRHATYVILLLSLLVGCANSPAKNERAATPLFIACEQRRPEICTREYRPVCATRDTGIRCVTPPCPVTDPKTYGNACTACSDPDVLGYQSGACKTTKE